MALDASERSTTESSVSEPWILDTDFERDLERYYSMFERFRMIPNNSITFSGDFE